jgi:ATP-dependent DNA helicase RecQ
MDPDLAAARALLQTHFGHPRFRPAQEPVLRSVLGGRDTLAVLPTGGGKSVCFQVPALVLGGLAVVVSPLISLMQDQVAAALGRRIPAAALTGGMTSAERERVWDDLRRNALRLLYVSPERLDGLTPRLRAESIRPTLLAVDEAHCISEWGHDFRPSYRRLRGARYKLGGPRTIALTGSATPAVREDIVRVLGFGAERAVHVGSFDRPNLWFGVVPVADERARLAALLDLLPRDGLSIVYAPTRGVTESLARALFRAGHRAVPYHAGLTRERRAATLDAFLGGRAGVVVATCAFGMGIDKPDVRLVVHWSLPPTPESYYQEAGRAGRDGEAARCVLLWRRGDAELHRRQLDVTFPPRRLLESVWSGATPPARVPAAVRESAERLRRELRPELGPPDWGAVAGRRRRAERRIVVMETYAAAGGCRRRTLIGYFGQRLEACAGCDRCDPEGPRRGRLMRRLLSGWLGA